MQDNTSPVPDPTDLTTADMETSAADVSSMAEADTAASYTMSVGPDGTPTEVTTMSEPVDPYVSEPDMTPTYQEAGGDARSLLGGDEPGYVLDEEAAEARIEEVDSSLYAPSLEPEDVRRALDERASPATPPDPNVNLDVPYIHQLWDTPDRFDGRWACGPTSTAMVLAYYGLLEPHPIEASKPFKHTSDYGWYISNSFTHGGRTFDASSGTKTGTGRGLYGAIVHDGLAHADTVVGNLHKGILVVLRHFMQGVGNTVEFVNKPTLRDVWTSLDDGHPVIISGNVFGWPHILVVRGYKYYEEWNAMHWIVNDPHGYENKSTYDGGGVTYRWWEIYHPKGSPSKYMYRIRGDFKPA